MALHRHFIALALAIAASSALAAEPDDPPPQQAAALMERCAHVTGFALLFSPACQRVRANLRLVAETQPIRPQQAAPAKKLNQIPWQIGAFQ